VGLFDLVNRHPAKRDTLPRKRQKPLKGTPFSQRFAQLRKQSGLTMTAISERVGVTPSYISLLEAGERQPSREIVLKLAATFFTPEDVSSLDELLVLSGLSPTRYELQLQPQDTLSIYEEALSQQPDDFKLYTALIRLLIRQGEQTQAEDRIYEGMKHFQLAWQLQALMAHLQLCLKGFESAATFQEAAIELFKRRYEGDPTQDPNFADLQINLGMIHYLWGMAHHEARRSADARQSSKLKKLALEAFGSASDYFEQALAIAPEDIYLLDEYARIRFNIADLSEGKLQAPMWQSAIERFIAVICAENVAALGIASVRELNAFLAHAYSRSGQFQEARKLIGVIQSTQPDDWLIAYVKACHYSLRAASESQPSLLDQALEALNQALKAHHPQNTSRQSAPTDPDLEPLRLGRPKAFAQRLNQA
jgi:transcriptional regulator with XRE-family HTH domain